MQRRIRWRIVLPYLFLLILVVTVFTIATVNQLQKNEQNRQAIRLLNTAKLIASVQLDNFEKGNEEEIFTSLAEKIAKTLEIDVAFLNPDGEIMGASPLFDKVSNQFNAESSFAKVRSTGEDTQIGKNEIFAVVKVANNSGQLLGFVYLQEATSAQFNNYKNIYWLSAAMILITGIGMILLALIIQDTSIRPVEQLTIAAQQMTMGNFRNLSFPNGPQELNDLNLALQKMAQQLGAQIDALTTERAKLSAVLNQMADGVLIIDPSGRVQLINPAAERIFQINQSQALDRSVVEVLRYHQLVDLWRIAKSGKRQSTMLEIGAQHAFLQAVAIPLKSALPGSTLLLFQDLTQLRRLETIRRDFISNVSHELRTPLASLKALAETLQEGALEDPPAAHRFILRMETEIDNLTQLVNELLELSRIESGKVPLSFHRVQPCNLLTPAYERMILQAERAGLEMALDCSQELPPVFADPDRIIQVLINLVHNAIKFTAPGGKITLSAYQDNNRIVFFVRDTGVGIARKDLGRIFERFYKADQARAGGGTGLGLSIARHMIEVHGGYIWAESEQNMGSTFYFTLPTA